MRDSDPFVQDVRGVRGAKANEQYASEQDDTPRADEPALLPPVYSPESAAPDVYDEPRNSTYTALAA